MKLNYILLGGILLTNIFILSMEEKENQELIELRNLLNPNTLNTKNIDQIEKKIKELIEQGVNFNNIIGSEILSNAIVCSVLRQHQFGLDDIVKLLIKSGAGKNYKGPLNVAAFHGDKEYVELLLNEGVNITASSLKKILEEMEEDFLSTIFKPRDKSDRNKIYNLIKSLKSIPPKKLINAIKQKDINLVKEAAQEVKKYQVTYKDEIGNTLLHYAVETKDPYIFKIILSLWPAALDEKNNSGKTPMELIVGTWQDGLKYVKEAAKEAKK